jgi:hypothetical protein
MGRHGGPTVALLLVLPLSVACGADPAGRVTPWAATVASGADADADTTRRVEHRLTYYDYGSAGGWLPGPALGTHLQGVSYYGRNMQPGVLMRGMTVSRSPATSGAQTATLQTFIYRRDALGNMSLETSDSQVTSIPAGVQSAQLGEDSWMLTGGAKTVSVSVVWRDELGQDLGLRFVFMNQRGDYACYTAYTRWCDVHDGFVTVTEPT